MSDTGAISRLANAVRRLEGPGIGLRVIATGLATLDLDEAEERARATIAVRAVTTAPDDLLLGARCRFILVEEGPSLVLLEPITEGRLAASLARFGQVPVVSYITRLGAGGDLPGPATAAGIRLSPPTPGPLGVGRLVLGGPAWGPHVIIIESAHHGAGAAGPPAATIER